MTIAYIDCFNGAAGDMLLAALLHAGLELSALEQVLAALPLEGYRIEYLPTTSHGITGSRLRIHVTTAQPSRDWRAIRALLEASSLPTRTRGWALATFQRLARAEGQIHGVHEDDVHFHEVGAVDSIIDTVGVCAGLELMGVEQVFASPLPTGSGWVRTQHGRMPVPAPATLALLTEVSAPLIPSQARGELLTPTAAALLAELATFEQPSMRVERVGYGFGWKEFDWVNGLRIWIGQSDQQPQPHDQQQLHHHHGDTPAAQEQTSSPRAKASESDSSLEQVAELRCNLDDVTGEVVAYTIEQLLASGALDAWATPVTMKKGRPGTQLGCLARPEDTEKLSALLLRETPTLGVRWQTMERCIAGRDHTTVATPWGAVRVKRKLINGAVAGASPEYADCAAIARAHGIPLASVYAAALQGLTTSAANDSVFT